MWIYKNNPDNSARFILGECGKRPLVCLGVNPSTAVPKKLDRTLSRVRNESIEKKFDGWIMLNLYPQRATDPAEIHSAIDEGIHKKNLEHIKGIFCSNSDLTVWAAWGGLIRKRAFLRKCLIDIVNSIEPYSVKWVSMGGRPDAPIPSTDLGKVIHPHHPLYLRKGLPLDPFDIKVYLNKLKSKGANEPRHSGSVQAVKITIKQALQSIKKLKKQHSIDKVLYLNGVRKDPSLAFDEKYQRTFKGYYRVRQRSAEFYNSFFKLLHLAAIGSKKETIGSLMGHLFKETHERHLSFCSKLLATLRDDAVIFDRNVATRLRVPYGVLPRQNWLSEAERRYDLIKCGVEKIVNQSNWASIEKKFDENFPEAVNLSKLRKADLILGSLL